MPKTMTRGSDAEETSTYDLVIVGGGSAGCILAHRLSASGRRRVLLLEAGPDTPANHAPASIYQQEYLPDYFSPTRYWTDLTVTRAPIGNRSVEEAAAGAPAYRYEQARVMGGGSSVNAQIAIRGLPSDYDEWADQGAAGWGWADCLPYFKRLERDLDFGGPEHGENGRIPIRRQFPEMWPSVAHAFRNALAENGIPYVEDGNAHDGTCCFPIPRNNAYGRRVSAAEAYLDGATRRRPNLRIEPDTRVESLLMDGRRAVGLVAVSGGRRMRIAAREIVVSAGALHTPSILMRAGIGPADHLSSLGIPVVADRPGIGANLQDHCLVGIGAHLRPDSRLAHDITLAMLVYARFSSGLEGCPANDMKMSLGGRFARNHLGDQFAPIRVGPDKAYSRGFVRLRGTDPHQEPHVAFNLLSDWRDKERMMTGVRFAYRVLSSDAFVRTTYSIFAAVYTNLIRSMMGKSLSTAVISRLASTLLDAGHLPRAAMMRFATSSDFKIHDLVRDDAQLSAFIDATVLGNWHACGTCRIGAADDRLAGVDAQGRVYGIENLRVADSSVLPTIPCANINLTTMMVAEKMSDAIARAA